MALTLPLNLTYPPLPFNSTGLVPQNLTGLNTGIGQNGNAEVPAILAGILVPHIVCSLFILARVWSRVHLLRKWFLDDTLIVVGWTMSTIVCVMYSVAAQTPHIRDSIWSPFVEMALESYLLKTYFGLIFYQLCLCITKLSILAFYLRMFSSRPMERRLAWGTVFFVLLYGVPLLFMSIFQCHPREGEFFGHPMKCFFFTPLLIASASLHTATDAWLIILIIPCILRLELPARQKVALAIVLSLSIFVIAASMVRLQLVIHQHYKPTSYQVVSTLAFFVMTILECDIALICASAPMLRPALIKIWPKALGERRLDNESRNSVNLTTVVSYHGYPWTEPTTPIPRSKNGSTANMQTVPPMPMPMPPMPALTAYHRTPTTLSLRSMLSSIAPRSRGVTVGADERPILTRGEDEVERRRSSVGFEGYYEQYMGYNESRNSRALGLNPSSFGDRRWTDSQESFVLGLNDPASPSRLSPVSGFSGDTFAVLGDPDAAQGRSQENGTESKMDIQLTTRKKEGQ